MVEKDKMFPIIFVFHLLWPSIGKYGISRCKSHSCHSSSPVLLSSPSWGDRFNSPVFFPLPAKLKSLRFGKRFNHSLANIKFPETLETLSFGAAFTQHILLPPKLQKLEFRGSFKLDGVKLPQSLRSLKIGLESLESLESPTALDSLKLDELEYLDEFMCQGLTVGCNNVAPLAGW